MICHIWSLTWLACRIAIAMKTTRRTTTGMFIWQEMADISELCQDDNEFLKRISILAGEVNHEEDNENGDNHRCPS
jgi:hypothetical protein